VNSRLDRDARRFVRFVDKGVDIVQSARVMSGPRMRQLTAFLPPPIRSQVEFIRQRWDPEMAKRIGAHFTVSHVVPGGDDWENGVDALQMALPLRVRIGGARNWGEPSGGIYLSVDDFDETVRTARRTLFVVEPPGVAYVPHVTLTHPRTTPPEIAEAAWAELDGWTVNEFVSIEALDVIEYDGLAWRTARRVALN
jgi:2'-5' RNA ligase